MNFRGKEKIVWSLNNYLGLANHPELRKVDAEAAAKFGMAAPMGARMMSGNSNYHEQLENELAAFEKKEDATLFNYGYQGIMSAIDAICGRHDVIVYDAESHACIIDGLRLHPGHRYVFKHNDIEDCEKQLQRATALIEKNLTGGILVITEGEFGMTGDQGKRKEITCRKDQYTRNLCIYERRRPGSNRHGNGPAGKSQHLLLDRSLSRHPQGTYHLSAGANGHTYGRRHPTDPGSIPGYQEKIGRRRL